MGAKLDYKVIVIIVLGAIAVLCLLLGVDAELVKYIVGAILSVSVGLLAGSRAVKKK